jgi:hypothetical protein
MAIQFLDISSSNVEHWPVTRALLESHHLFARGDRPSNDKHLTFFFLVFFLVLRTCVSSIGAQESHGCLSSPVRWASPFWQLFRPLDFRPTSSHDQKCISKKIVIELRMNQNMTSDIPGDREKYADAQISTCGLRPRQDLSLLSHEQHDNLICDSASS